jgi:hypothetical protein
MTTEVTDAGGGIALQTIGFPEASLQIKLIIIVLPLFTKAATVKEFAVACPTAGPCTA